MPSQHRRTKKGAQPQGWRPQLISRSRTGDCRSLLLNLDRSGAVRSLRQDRRGSSTVDSSPTNLLQENLPNALSCHTAMLCKRPEYERDTLLQQVVCRCFAAGSTPELAQQVRTCLDREKTSVQSFTPTENSRPQHQAFRRRIKFTKRLSVETSSSTSSFTSMAPRESTPYAIKIKELRRSSRKKS